MMAAAVSGVASVGWMLVGSGSQDTEASGGPMQAGMDGPPPSVRPGTAIADTASNEASSVGGEIHPEAHGTYAGAYRDARRRFEQSLVSLDFDTLFAPSRLATTEDLKLARRTVAAAKNIVGVYRGDEIRTDGRFGHPAASLRESFSTARMTDSLLTAIDSLYGLLEASSGRYRVRGRVIAFTDLGLATQFTRQATWLEARRRVWRPGAPRTPMTIGSIVAAVDYVPQARTNF